MLDIYNSQERDVIFKLVCHTSVGDKNDKHGRFFEVGKTYKAKLEPIRIKEDTFNKPCTLVWVSSNEGFWSRFAVVGNIKHSDGEGYWPGFSEYFNCPLEEERDSKIKEILK